MPGLQALSSSPVRELAEGVRQPVGVSLPFSLLSPLPKIKYFFKKEVRVK